MFKLVAVVLLCLFAMKLCSPSRPLPIWRRWDAPILPFRFTYEFRPDWCIDKDPYCVTFSEWCISANESRLNYMKKACRRTCYMCYEGMNHTETCFDKMDDCAKREEDCFKEATAEFMYDSCPKTCGFCNNVCADLATNCAQLNGYCMYSDWHQAVMRSRCRLTCAFCRVYDRENFEPPICYDMDEGCRGQKDRCEIQQFRLYLRRNCAHTCGYCDYFDVESDIPTECTDASRECHKMKHLCYVTGQHSVQMWRDCQRTCGYCPEYYFEESIESD